MTTTPCITCYVPGGWGRGLSATAARAALACPRERGHESRPRMGGDGPAPGGRPEGPGPAHCPPPAASCVLPGMSQLRPLHAVATDPEVARAGRERAAGPEARTTAAERRRVDPWLAAGIGVAIPGPALRTIGPSSGL